MSGTHSHGRGAGKGGTRHRLRIPLIVLTVVVAVAAVVVVTEVVPKSDTGRAASAPTPAANAADVSGPFTVVATSPANTATAVPSDATITVQLSDPVASGSPTPTLSPAVAGSWQLLTPTTFTFVAAAPFVPSTTETIAVPATVTSTDGKTLGTATSAEFTVAAGTTLRLQQLLATLGYLPLSFTPAGPLTAPQEAAVAQAGYVRLALDRAGRPDRPVGRGHPQHHHQGRGRWPSRASTASRPTAPPDRRCGRRSWPPPTPGRWTPPPTTTSTSHRTGRRPPPSTATAPRSTPPWPTPGWPVPPPRSGTFPVYERFVSTTMTGTNPDGSKYSDPDIPWVSYFNGGDALHGFVRGSYGFPQSDGCVEMPPAHAAVVYPLTPLGTLVTVS